MQLGIFHSSFPKFMATCCFIFQRVFEDYGKNATAISTASATTTILEVIWGGLALDFLLLHNQWPSLCCVSQTFFSSDSSAFRQYHLSRWKNPENTANIGKMGMWHRCLCVAFKIRWSHEVKLILKNTKETTFNTSLMLRKEHFYWWWYFSPPH